MFLTKKSVLKIIIMVLVYFVLGGICIVLSSNFRRMGVEDNFLFTLGLIAYLLCVPIYFWGRYAEGKGKIINLGNKLVRRELRPAEFLKQYEALKNSDELVIMNPSVEVLRLIAIAYDLLGERAKTLETVEELINVANDKKKNISKLIKTSYLYSYGMVEEAELLFNKLQREKLDIMSNSMADAILKSDRAMVMGDYSTAEAYCLSSLKRSFPKLDNLGTLVVHYMLGEVYEKTQDNEKAIMYYNYCTANGGETAIRKSAMEKLECLK